MNSQWKRSVFFEKNIKKWSLIHFSSKLIIHLYNINYLFIRAVYKLIDLVNLLICESLQKLRAHSANWTASVYLNFS